MDVRNRLDQPIQVVTSAPLRVALADPRPLVRRLQRFLLEEAGAEVVGEAETGLGSARLVADRRPDVLLVNETLPVEADEGVLPSIRTGSPSTKVVVLSIPPACSFEIPPWAGADAFVPENYPLDELLALVTRLSRASPPDVVAISTRRSGADESAPDASARDGSHRRGVQGLVAASIAILAMVIGAGWLSTAPTGSAPRPAATNELHVAFAALHDLVGAIHDGSPSALADAQRLAGSWARAAEAGADVSRLLDEIRAQVPKALRAVASNGLAHGRVGSGGRGKHLGWAKHPDVGHGSGAQHAGDDHGRSSGPHPPNGHGRSAPTKREDSKPGHVASSPGKGRVTARHASRSSAEHGRPS